MSSLLRIAWNSNDHISHRSEPKPPYIGVVSDIGALGGIESMDYLYAHGCPIPFPYNVIIVFSIPFDIAADTICLPYDLYSYFSDKSDIRFWEDIFARNDTSLPLKEYKSHFSTAGRNHAWHLLGLNTQGYPAIHRKNEGGKWIEEKITYPQGKISPEMYELFGKIQAEWRAALDAKRAKSTPPPVEPQKPEATHE
jgi:hypothetical protein